MKKKPRATKAIRKPLRKIKKIITYNSNQDVPATVGHINEFRAEMNSKFASMELKFKSQDKKIGLLGSRMDSLDSRMDSLDKKIDSVKEELRSEIATVSAAVHRVGALVEEQNAKNNAMFDQMKLVLDHVTRLDDDFREFKKRSFIQEV